MDGITFNGKVYPVRVVELEDFGTQRIGVESLEKEMFDDAYDFVSKEAQYVDEQIFYYVPDNIISDETATIECVSQNVF